MRIITRRPGRVTAAVAAGAVLFSVATAVPASAAKGDPSDIVESCENAPSAESKFSDYKNLPSRQKKIVDCLASGYTGGNGSNDFVLKGGSDGKANFTATITRAQFAAVLNRLGDYLGLPTHAADPDNPTFADVKPGSNIFFGAIEELFARGLTTGAGQDVDDVDGDGDRQELVFDPGGSVTYAQVLSFTKRLLVDGAKITLPTGQSHNEFKADCGVFNGDRDVLDQAGFLRRFNTPNDCKAPAPRGLVFDLAAVALDLAVELNVIVNPHAPPAGSMKGAVDSTDKFTDEFANTTITVLDPQGAPIVGQRVEVFAVNATATWDKTSNPPADATANVGSTTRHGTGDTPAQIDANDTVTDQSGTVSISVGTSATTTTSYTLYAFIGDIGDRWSNVVGKEGESVAAGTIKFSVLPSKLVVTMNTSSTGKLPYGTSHVVNYQLLDANDKPVEVDGLSILARMDRDPNVGANDIQTANIATDITGLARWNRPGALDPQPDKAGNSTVDTFRGTWDRNRDGVANASDLVFTQTNGAVTFLDRPSTAVESAKLELVNGNSNKLDQTGALANSSIVEMRTTVTNIYGSPVNGMRVDFRTSDVVQPNGFPLTAVTNSSGVATATYSFASVADHVIVAWVDADNSQVVEQPLTSGDIAAEAAPGDPNIRARWVNAAPDQVPTTTNTYANQLLAGYTSDFAYLDQGAVRLPFDGGGVADNYAIANQAVTRADFLAAIRADTNQNDTVTVTYDADSVSQWNLTVVE